MSQSASRPRVSLLIPNRNNEPALDLVFERLAANTTYPDVEVVVVDDGSTDRSLEILRRWRESGRFRAFQLEEREHAGVVEALNHGLRKATGEVIVQLDADASVETRDWIQKMLELYESDPKVGVVTAKVVLDSGQVHAFGVNLVGPEGFHDRGTRVLEPAGRRRLHQRVERLPWQLAHGGDRPAEVDAGIGCCMMYGREDALAVGGYDPGFQPVWFDDIDLAMSIRAKLGKKAFFLPDVLVIHRLGLRATHEVRTGLSERIFDFKAKVGSLIGPDLRTTLAMRFNLDKLPAAQAERLAHHYAYWQRKWGWDMLNPDMEAVIARWGPTEVCWRRDDEMRAEGQRILDTFDASRTDAAHAQRYVRRFGFLPPPPWSLMQPYDHILETVRKEGLARLDGDFLEIGVFLGGGTYQLAKLLETEAPERKMYALDVFEPDVDPTQCDTGVPMRELYRYVLGAGDQRELYDAVVAGCPNVVTIAGDSAEVDLPTERIAFAHIDGSHDPAYVRSDFEKVWARTVPGGVVAFDDYGFDLPQVTAIVDRLRDEHADEVSRFWTAGLKTAFIQR